MQPDLFNTYESIAKLPAQVTALYITHGIQIRPCSDLAGILKLCTNSLDKIGTKQEEKLLELCNAQRVLLAILDCSKEPEIKEALKRITAKPLTPASHKPSSGKDAVFELEFLQYIRHRGLAARLGEPDIVVQASFGDYFIACKTINSLSNLESQLRSGCKQVTKYGYGCLALNFEPQICIEQLLCADTPDEIFLKLDTFLQGLYKDKILLFEQKLKNGQLDGVVLQVSCFAKIVNSISVLDTFTHTRYFSRSNIQGRDACVRFDEFKLAMSRHNILG